MNKNRESVVDVMSKVKKYFMFSCCFFAVFSLFVTSVNASWGDIIPKATYDAQHDKLELYIDVKSHGGIQSITGINCRIKDQTPVKKWYKLGDMYINGLPKRQTFG